MLILSICLPVHNAEEFLEDKFESLLTQSFQDYEIIVSDNASSDSTQNICNKFIKRDSRIRYFRQVKNMGAVWNYNFVLQQAKGKFVMWTAADDKLLPGFLEKNISILQSNTNAVGCMSNVEFHNIKSNKLIRINKYLKKIGIGFRPFSHFSITGTYDKKISNFLKKMPWHLFYGVYKTEVLKKHILKQMVGFDALPIIHVLKYGDIEIIEESLFDSDASGRQSEGMIQMTERLNKVGMISKIFPYYPLSLEIKKMIGTKLFLFNIHHVIRLNFDAFILILIDLLSRIKYYVLERKSYSKNLSNDL